MRRWLPLGCVAIGGCLVPDPLYGVTDGADGADGGALESSGSGAATDAGPVGDGATDGEDSGTDGVGESETGAPDPPTDPLPADCSALPSLPADAIVVGPDDNAMLSEIIANAPDNATVALQPGTYDRQSHSGIVVSSAGLTLRSTTDRAEDVVIEGSGADLDWLVRIDADDVTLADITVQGASFTQIFMRPDNGTLFRPALYRVIVRDGADTGFEARPATDGEQAWVDQGIIACSTFEFTAAQRDLLDACSGLGAIRVNGGADWVVRDNTIDGYWCSVAGEPSGYAVLVFDEGARDTLIIRNRLHNNHRGVLFGGDGPNNPRPANDSPCGRPTEPWGHVGGLIANNVITATDPALGAGNGTDSMISMWRACGTAAVHNTLFASIQIFHAIEWRYEVSSVTVANNIATGDLASRESGFAFVASNAELVGAAEFVDAPGDLHPTGASVAIDGGNIVPGVPILADIDGTPRVGIPDLGAYEAAR